MHIDTITIFPFTSKLLDIVKRYFSHQQIFSSYAHGHNFEEEANVHDLPYGYELGDDPFES
mgnify:CR=1 FL=1